MHFKINKTTVGLNNPAYIIAELSANHEQNYDLAVATIIAMKDSGANAVKLQTYKPDSFCLDSDKPWFQTRQDSLWAGQKMFDLYKKGETPFEWHEKLQTISIDLGMDFFSSPFDLECADFLENLDVPAYKIASFEIMDIPLIDHVARKGKPIILSTGIAKKEDIQLAVQTCRDAGNNEIALLKCTSSYPTPVDQVNLATIPTLASTFRCISGLSDHTLGIEIPIGAVALGAKIIEKHFVLDKDGNGLDKDFSLTPDEFKQMTNSVRTMEKAVGSSNILLSEKQEQARSSGRSLFAIKDMAMGEVFTKENIKSLRPSLGLHPKNLTFILGKKATEKIEKGTPLTENLITW